jgi:hypothetical protein
VIPTTSLALAARRYAGQGFRATSFAVIGHELTGPRRLRFLFLRSLAMKFPIDALRAVLDYLWEDEEEHYREDCSSGHIFLELQKLKAWLESQ